MKISFMNTKWPIVRKKLGADVDIVRRGIGNDERIGKRFYMQELVMAEAVSPRM